MVPALFNTYSLTVIFRFLFDLSPDTNISYVDAGTYGHGGVLVVVV